MVCCALALSGCAGFQVPRIDPSGERIFVHPNQPQPGPPTLAMPPTAPAAFGLPIGQPQWGISINPSQVVAPVGSEVVLIASVAGETGFLLNNAHVEWSLDPTGSGEFLSPGERRPFEIMKWLHGLPRKLDSRYVVNTTLTSSRALDRGTPTPTDDVVVQSGQAWVTVTSPTEGTSHVTAFSPDVYGWDRRQQTATIYWVDAQWRFPAPAIVSAGNRHVLATTLSRQSDGSPLPGWVVRYEVAGGPEAEFAPGGAKSVEVVSDATGQATAELSETQPVAGTSQINIQVLRPATTAGQARSVPVGAGSVLVTWTSGDSTPPVSVPSQPAQGSTQAQPPRLDIVVGGPDTASVGSDVQFQIQVTNRGPGPATRLVITDRFDPGLEHATRESAIEKDLVDLPPGGTTTLTVTLRVVQEGEQCQEIVVQGDPAVRATARKCITARAAAIAPPAGASTSDGAPQVLSDSAGLAVRMTGPNRQRVGELALFSILVSNNTPSAIENLRIALNFDNALDPAEATVGSTWLEPDVLGWKIGTLEAGKTIRQQIAFKCLREAASVCSRATVTGTGIEAVTQEACLEIGDGQPAASAPAGASQPQPTPAATTLEVTVADTADPLKVGGQTSYQILVTNKGTQSAFDVVVTATFGSEIQLKRIEGDLEGSVLAGAVRFNPRRELRAGETLNFELSFQGARPGTAKLAVQAGSRGQPRPATAEQTTDVLPAM